MAECEAVLLGREPIYGSANAIALAALVKTLMRKSDLRRKYILRCNRDSGLQMIPYRRVDDEGFESDEDLASLGSYEDNSASMYVSDHALRVAAAKCRSQQPRSSSQLSSNTDATSGSVSSVGTDSANSSGASDNDDTDNSLSHNVNQPESAADKKKSDDSQRFSFHEVAFCHTDPSLPKIIVWVVKTKERSKSTNEYSYGLEAIVFQCRNEEKFRSLYKHFQELSRRQKLDKPVRNRWKEEICDPKSKFAHNRNTAVVKKAAPVTVAVRSTKDAEKTAASVTASAVADTKVSPNNAVVMYNLVQRVDTDGVTHIEVTRPLPENRRPKTRNDNLEPSSIISINTPDSGDLKTVSKKSENFIESLIRTETDTRYTNDDPPERPERKKHNSANNDETSSKTMAANREKVVRGQYVRVAVDQKMLSSPTSRGGWLFGNEAKPCGGSTLSYPARLVWNREKDNVENATQQRRSRSRELPPNSSSTRHRSKSSVILRRADSPKRYPMSHRYIDTIHINNSLPNRFFGKLKELTSTNLHGGSKFRRRNSIGDLTNQNYYQLHGHGKKLNQSLAKSTPNLKPVIKNNKNGKFYKNGYNDHLEPKKVTFSAYATVQVVD